MRAVTIAGASHNYEKLILNWKHMKSPKGYKTCAITRGDTEFPVVFDRVDVGSLSVGCRMMLPSVLMAANSFNALEQKNQVDGKLLQGNCAAPYEIMKDYHSRNQSELWIVPVNSLHAAA